MAFKNVEPIIEKVTNNEEETQDVDALQNEKKALWGNFPNVTKDQIRRMIEIRDLLGDDLFYKD